MKTKPLRWWVRAWVPGVYRPEDCCVERLYATESLARAAATRVLESMRDVPGLRVEIVRGPRKETI